MLSEVQRGMYGAESPSDIFPTYHLIKANSFDDIARDTLDEWIYFLKNSIIKDEFSAKGLEEAREKLRADSLDSAEKEAYEVYVKSERIRRSEIDTAFFDGQKSVKEELLPLLEEERRQKEEARMREEEERRQKEAIQAMMAKLLHAQGKSIEEIAKTISITEDQVKALLG